MKTQEQTNTLFEQQKRSWPLLRDNWERLKEVRLKTFEFDGFSIRAQLNPERIISSSARVDKTSIKNRKCFLCAENRPEEEDHVLFRSEYEILCNPFPIFEKHFTLARTSHTPQVIAPEFGWFLELSRALPELFVFYNAPDCGASAPDHMHFQAGKRGILPLEQELDSLIKRYGEPLSDGGGLTVTAMDDGLRRMILLESHRKELLMDAFGIINDFTSRMRGGKEPMLNMLAYFIEDRWQIFIFPREKHRPWQYFEKGDKNILLSPAAIDMGGLLIIPLEKDFRKISKDDIKSIFEQVCISEKHFAELQEYLSGNLNHQI
ncbi:MAG: DUF4922 domain-containing protein [Bacteroidales bacterium]